MLTAGSDNVDEVKAAWLELKARVEELASERHHYLEVFDRSPEAYVITDAQGTIAEANGAAVDIFQRRKHHLKGKPLAALVALDQRHAFRTRLRALGGREIAAEWNTIIEAPGLRVPVKVAARLMRSGICWRLRAEQS